MSGMSSSGKSSLTGASIPFEGAVEVHAMQALLNSYLQTARDNYLSSTYTYIHASSTSEMLCRSQWSRSVLSECIHVAVVGHHLMPV